MSSESKRLHLAHQSNSTDEWYTPPQYIDAARRVMGNIDLDPASCTIANKNVQATQFFTKEDDGLTRNWGGNIWLNPPYSKKLLTLFVNKLLMSTFEQAIVLVHNCTETKWFRKLVERATGIVFTDHRINFLRPDGTSSSGNSTRGQAFLYFGDKSGEFLDTFKQFGWGALI